MYVVYSLEDPRDNKIWYVGMTDNLQRRFIQHLRCEGDNTAKNEWIHNLAANGYVPIMRTLETLHSMEMASKREQYWINHYEHLHMPLTNQMWCHKKGQRPTLPAVTIDSKALTDLDTRILRLIREGTPISKVIAEIYGVKSGAMYTQRSREVMALIARVIPA